MKKKLAMRIASFALCLIFTASLFGAPKSKAVVAETALGVAVLGAYLQATGLTLSASSGATGELVTTGLTDIVDKYVSTVADVASSTTEFITRITAGSSILGDGRLVISGAIVKALGALVAWFVGENGLEDAGTTSTVVPATSVSYNGVFLPDIENVWPNKTTYPHALMFLYDNGYYYFYSLIFSQHPFIIRSGDFYFTNSSKYISYQFKVSHTDGKESDTAWGGYYSGSLSSSSSYQSTSVYSAHWSTYDVVDASGDVILAACDPVYEGQFDILRSLEFTQPDLTFDDSSTNQMVLDLGLSAGATLDDVATVVPEQLAAGTLAPTYEITVTGTGEGTDDEETVPGADATTIGFLQSILEQVKTIPDSITQGFADVFTPSQEAVDSLSAEVDSKLPFIGTLQGFGSSLVYNLEHPEACADGLGLTTVVDLGKGRGSYLGNTKHDLLDVSWYLEYKPLVDDIIVGFCWLCFLWNCYGALPRIIHGEGSIAGVVSMMQEGGSDDS